MIDSNGFVWIKFHPRWQSLMMQCIHQSIILSEPMVSRGAISLLQGGFAKVTLFPLICFFFVLKVFHL